MEKLVKVAVLGVAGLVTYKIGKHRGMNILMKRIKELAKQVVNEEFRDIIINEGNGVICQ